MAFNKGTKEKIVKQNGEYLPCVMCGRTFPPPDAAHIIDEKEWKRKKQTDSQINGIPLCKTCHIVFDDYLRARLYAALDDFGSKNLPISWKESKKKQIKEDSTPLPKVSLESSPYPTPENHGKPWSEKEEKQLLSRYHQKMSLEAIAKKHKRGIGGVHARLVKLGKLELEN